MNPTFPATAPQVNRALNFVLSACLWLGATFAVAAAEPAAAPGNPPAAAMPALASVPKSVFVVPTSPKEGRNPFFPQAKPTTPPPMEKERPLDVNVFVLNGITGPPRRSAMINGRTFIPGEEGEIRLQSGAKVMIKCEDIRDESAVIVVGGLRRELRLRFGI